MILVRIALGNLVANRWKTILVGTFLVLGTIVLVLGNSFMDAIEKSTSTSIIHSLTGHIQIYNQDAEEPFKIYGELDGTRSKVGFIEDFPRVRASLEALESVESVVPMGIDTAVITSGNVMEVQLSKLRTALRNGDMDKARALHEHVREMVALIREQLQNADDLVDIAEMERNSPERFAALAEVQKPEFWQGFERDPLNHLEFLENKVAPLALDGDLVWIGYLGTNPASYTRSFRGFQVVDGQAIPEGKRGFMFAKHVYDRHFKNKIAHRLDQIEERLDAGDTLEECEDCQTWIGMNTRQTRSIAMQLDHTERTGLQANLAESLGAEDELDVLLKNLLTLTDANAREHIATWRALVEPRILLYSVPVGGKIELTAFGRGGYPRTVAVHVYGVYRFAGLGDSPISGSYHLMDLMTFRDLYGHMTEERKVEIATMRSKSGLQDIPAQDAEEALFGSDAPQVEEVQEALIDSNEDLQLGDVQRFTGELLERTYTQEEMESGLIVNAAVLLKDDVDPVEARREIDALIAAESLGVQSIGWREASGHVGEFIGVIRAVLHIAVLVIFLVALIILNNTLMMATMERSREIGTLRAIGAQRPFVRRMIFVETAILSVAFGGLGVLLASGTVTWIAIDGIAPLNDATQFLFAGEPLRPALTAAHLLTAFLAIAGVSVLSTLYPAILATRVTPLEAMRAEK